ncbi:MAG: creatininase family protein [Gemmatimonadales bacterium]
MDTIHLGELTWQEAKERFQLVDVALLPIGAVEQHGPHLPLDTDAFDAAHLAAEVATACSTPQPVVLPLIPYGVSYHHDAFEGTIEVSPESLSRMVHDIGLSASRNGVKKLIMINGHGGIETSTSLAVRPALVRLDKARRFVPKFSNQYLDFTSKRSVTWYARTHRISPSGVLGDPTKASREKGERMWAVMVKNLVELVEHLKTMSLEEIYQTRY